MLKWFRRDKNDPLAPGGPPGDPAAAPAVADDARASNEVDIVVANVESVERPESVQLTPEAAPGSAERDTPTSATPATEPLPVTEPVIQRDPEPVEAPVPWWRYEGVWRSPKAPPARAPVPAPIEAPIARAPVPEQVEAPAARVPVPAPVEAPAVRAPVPVPVPEEPAGRDHAAALVEVAPARSDQALVPANALAARDPVPAAIAGAPAGRDQAPQPFVEPEDSVPALFAPPEPVPESPKPSSLRERLAATARALTASVGSLFRRNPKLDEDLLEELETALIQADVGVTASTELVAKLGVRMRKREFADAQALLAALRTDLRALIVNYARPLHIPASPRPFVILTVGVNGAGKTTTIGKLAMRYKQAGHSVMLAAGDTFRAAAVEQLKTWGDRNQVAVIAQGSGADSASVIFDALQAAKSRGIDVLIADTAGRLHTQGHLMQELAKVKRVLGKIDPEAPHETLLVIDGGTGQNALNQAKQFHQAVGLTGIAVTKLDGTAKGGMVFALCRELGLPIRFIGVGEKREDLREFVAEDFVDALLPRELGG